MGDVQNPEHAEREREPGGGQAVKTADQKS
jgi:hypothetical protein